MSQVTRPSTGVFKTVEVNGPNGRQSVLLEGLRASATAAEIKHRAHAELSLDDDVDWNLRDNRTGRLLLDDQRLSEFSDESSPHVELTMQPDAALG